MMQKPLYYETLEALQDRARELYPGKLIFSKTEIANILGISRKTLYNNRKKYRFDSGCTLQQVAKAIS